MIRGHFEHDPECLKGQFSRVPERPVHPAVFKLALKQLMDGASLSTRNVALPLEDRVQGPPIAPSAVTSSKFNKDLAEAVFHYSPRTSQNDRFEVCISTKEMRDATWKHAHHGQIHLDGTFGVCNKKVLLFIVMAVDEANRGVPLAFFLFSAPSGNKHTAAGYDTAVLERMLSVWKHSLG